MYGGFKKSISGYTRNRMQNPTIKFDRACVAAVLRSIQHEGSVQICRYCDWLRPGRPVFDFRLGTRDFCIPHSFSTNYREKQSPVQWMSGGGGLPEGKAALGVKLTTNLYLVPRSSAVELYHASMSSWHSV
jgi:hypothetical protein